ncbi:DNA repair protein RecO [Mesorhizobium sp. LNJC405B00]|uniref:DNA repair protein RecO n=1 Tax=Mesorhizobium sp. LNJC405B00 TaxID=1287281 RepID=UPI0003CE8E33|nr:DNA repair protein RecO [Mesorhizobium sp. LNJC405B00]ESX87595.1 DNA repair protein RecO [Mesorhizobium sp. LNJC405B00]
MEWRDEGIILGTRKHGETSAILEVMTRAHGRHLGLVRGGRSRKQQPVLQPGNRVDLLWRARLDEHLGTFQAEAIEMNAARLMDSAVAVYGLQTTAAHLRLLPERDAHGGLYETLAVMIAHLDDSDAAGELVARFELLILDELGFGLDLSQCAATGARQDLAYVSPKSGRAVSRAAGAPWRDKMLALPAFLQRGSGLRADHAALEDAFHLTGFFFTRHVYEPRGIEQPDARAGFLAALRKHHSGGNAATTADAAPERGGRLGGC